LPPLAPAAKIILVTSGKSTIGPSLEENPYDARRPCCPLWQDPTSVFNFGDLKEATCLLRRTSIGDQYTWTSH